MMRTWNKIGLLTILTTTLCAVPVLAADPKLDDYQSLAAGHIQKLEDAVKDLNNRMEDLNARMAAAQDYIKKMKKYMEGINDTDRLKDQLEKLKELDQLQVQVNRIQKEMKTLAHVKDIDQLADMMTDMRNDLEKIDGKRKSLVNGSKTPSKSAKNGTSKVAEAPEKPAPDKDKTPPAEKGTPAPESNPPATEKMGKIRIVNIYPSSITIIVNDDKVVRVDQGDTKIVPIEVGPMTYEVVTPGGSRPPVSHDMRPYEVFSITVYANK